MQALADKERRHGDDARLKGSPAEPRHTTMKAAVAEWIDPWTYPRPYLQEKK